MVSARSNSEICIRLVHRSAAEYTKGVARSRLGLQDRDERVVPGTVRPDAVLWFECSVEIIEKADGETDFRGPFVHGPPSQRFLYISWVRPEGSPPWLRRIKIPLSGITASDIHAAQRPGRVIEADISARQPHATAPIAWKAATRS